MLVSSSIACLAALAQRNERFISVSRSSKTTADDEISSRCRDTRPVCYTFTTYVKKERHVASAEVVDIGQRLACCGITLRRSLVGQKCGAEEHPAGSGRQTIGLEEKRT